jgi:hypothetical protein
MRAMSARDDDRNLTWAALLASWTDFAKAAVALPKSPEGDRWRETVPAIIELQAATCALADLHRLPARDRYAALDTAEALITRRASQLNHLWSEEPPETVVELILDAHSATSAARTVLDAESDSP